MIKILIIFGIILFISFVVSVVIGKGKKVGRKHKKIITHEEVNGHSFS